MPSLRTIAPSVAALSAAALSAVAFVAARAEAQAPAASRRPTPEVTCASTNVPLARGIAAREVARTPALKQVVGGAYRVGAAINPHQFHGRDATGVALVARHFDTITPENVLKWECVHPAPGRYTFAPADAYVAFGRRHGMFVVGHTLVWHSQTPAWVFQDSAGQPIGREAGLARMREHIRTVMGRYAGRIQGWDVVNEALNEDGTLRDSPWRRAIGDDYIVEAFRAAQAADPTAELYYNDYGLENPAKLAGTVRLVRELQAAGVRIDAVGTQEHNHLTGPTAGAIDTTIATLGALGVKVAVTELDVDVLPRIPRVVGADVNQRAARQAAFDPYPGGLPDSVQQALARRYAEHFAVFARHRGTVSRVTFWGVRDSDSWLNYWPVAGRTSYPLLFDRAGRPKPAFDAVVEAIRGGSAGAASDR